MYKIKVKSTGLFAFNSPNTRDETADNRQKINRTKVSAQKLVSTRPSLTRQLNIYPAALDLLDSLKKD